MLDATMQVVALCGYGNLLLSNCEANLEGLSNLSCFKSVDTFLFIRASAGKRIGAIASLPSSWLRKMHAEDVRNLRFCSDPVGMGIKGVNPQGPMFSGILCEGNAGAELWSAEWKFRGDRGDGRNWKVAYESERIGRRLVNRPTSIESARAQWMKSLNGLVESLKRQGQTLWIGRLEMLLTLSEQSAPLADRFMEIVPRAGLAEPARALLADAIRTQMMLSSAEYLKMRELGSFDRMTIDVESTLWRAIGASYEASLHAQEVALDLAA